jgi:sugar (pentulose or hexulose) kinase
MTLVLSIDIGTHESKGVLVSTEGRIVASAAVPHETTSPARLGGARRGSRLVE